VSTAPLPSPLRHFVAQLDEQRSADVPDLDKVGRLLVELAADEEFSAPLILLGDDMLLFDREEYDPEQGTWRALAPGDPGWSNR
jgi:hypothetical protein